MAKTILGIAMAEMMHLQRLGELICLLAGMAVIKRKKHTLKGIRKPECLRMPSFYMGTDKIYIDNNEYI